MPVFAGDIVGGKYRVEHLLGEGGMGVVVAARHLGLEELFALKIMKREVLGLDVSAERRFIAEARAAARLKGDHVARVHDIGRLDTGELYMVMEHLKGTDLKQVLRSRGRLPLVEAVTYLLQTCEAIAEAHALDIVHRDIKPNNLFLVDGGSSIKVLDFGISKQPTTDGSELTGTNVMLGTLSYMSPEQMQHSKRVDARSDVWSMGVVFYELVTGQVPFPGQGVFEIVTEIYKGVPPPPSQVQPDLPVAVDAAIARCLQIDPALRFASAHELAAALRALLVPPSHTATPPAPISSKETASSSYDRTTKRHQREVIPLPILVPVPQVDAAALAPQRPGSTESTPVKPMTSRSARVRWALGVAALGLAALAVVAFRGGPPATSLAQQPSEGPTATQPSETEREQPQPPAESVADRRVLAGSSHVDSSVVPPIARATEAGPSNNVPTATASSDGAPRSASKLRGTLDDRPASKLRGTLGDRPAKQAPVPAPSRTPRKQTFCTVKYGDNVPFMVDVSAYTAEQRSQLIDDSTCRGAAASDHLCCVREHVDLQPKPV
jgi:serine/threonine-protein kinase